MSDIINQLQINYTDEDGDSAISFWSVPEATTTTAAVADLIPLVRAVTSAAIPRYGIYIDDGIDGEAASDNPYDAADKAVLQFRCADGSLCNVVVPAPEASIFLADDETVDKSNGDVNDFVTQALILLVNMAASELVELIKGWRSRRTRKRA